MKYNYVIHFSSRDLSGPIGGFETLDAAKKFLAETRYTPGYNRSFQPLDLSADGMSGSGQDMDGQFTYSIQKQFCAI